MSTNDAGNGNNIYSLDAGRISGSPKLDKLERYWNSVRGNRLVPSRCEIDPRGLEGVLPNAFILERIAGGLARFRIAGSHLTEATGFELRHMPISALFKPPSREILSDAMQAVFDDPASVRFQIESQAAFGRERLAGEMILLPLRSDLGDVDRVLGGIALEGKFGRTPRRLDVISQSRRSLVGYAGPQHATDTEEKRPADAPTQEPPVPKPERSHLTLVIDNG